MTKRDIYLVALVAMLGGWYIFHFTNWFRHKYIPIEHTVRVVPAPGRAYGVPGKNPDKDQVNVIFSFREYFRLTSVRVVSISELRTNRKDAHALWALVARKGSSPVNGLSYGNLVPGMKSALSGAEAEPLEPGVEYRLLVEAGSVRGTNDFSVPASSAALGRR
jgi:hypothetical protein